MFLAGLLLAALALRVVFLLELRGDVLFESPPLDEDRYLGLARSLLGETTTAGLAEAGRPYWQPPGIVYVLAALLRLSGPGLFGPRLAQALVSTASCWLVHLLARRLWPARVALLACALCGLHGVLIFEASELLPATWALFFVLLALACFADGQGRLPRSLATGLALGTAALFSPTVLLAAPLAAWRLRRPALIAALGLGLLLPIGPVTARNWAVSGELVLISTNGGLNFYLGNNPRAEETLALRPGWRWRALAGEPEAQGLGGRAAQSRYFFAKGLAHWREEPLAACRGFLRKLYLFLNGAEIPRDTDLRAFRKESLVLGILTWGGAPDRLLLPLALLGAWFAWRERRAAGPLAGMLLVQWASTALFFVSSRHRVPALGGIVLFAAAGLDGLWTRRRTLWPATAALLLVGLNLPVREAAPSYEAELDFYRGLALDPADRPAAIGWYRRAIAKDPGDGRFWSELGDALAQEGRAAEAIGALRRALALDPGDQESARRLERLSAARGGPTEQPAPDSRPGP